MAFDIEDIDNRRKKMFEETFTKDVLKKIENNIDDALVRYIKEEETEDEIVYKCSFFYEKDSDDRKMLLLMFEHDYTTTAFFKRYEEKGWSVKHRYNNGGHPSLTFSKIVRKASPPPELADSHPPKLAKPNWFIRLIRRLINKKQEEPSRISLLEKEHAKAQEELCKTQHRLAEIECEIQLLTESPNSRDPPLLAAAVKTE